MPCSRVDTGQPFSIDIWTDERQVGEPESEYCDTLDEARGRARTIVQAGRFRFVTLHKRGNGPLGWKEFDSVSAED